MGALANYIERAGVATTSISLIREQSEAVKPPRALWVPFALGRPLGSAADADFQKRVMRAAFGLLETARAPAIEDFPAEAPEEASADSWVCPVSFPVPEAATITARLSAEVARLAPWSAETRAARGRTLFGVTGASVDDVGTLARALGSVADSGDVVNAPDVGIDWTFEMPLLLRHMADDLRTFYHEAIAAQPGPAAPNHAALTTWIFAGTALGEALQAIARHLTADDSRKAKFVRGLLIPEGFYEGGSAFPASAEFGAPNGKDGDTRSILSPANPAD
ncbi:MAG: hypothetical protein AAF458_05760 [Pseudomonadota bacterium]